MDELNLSFRKTKSKLNLNNLPSYLMKNSKSQGEGDIKDLYKWVYEDKTIRCFGWYDGDSGFENKHDLPPGGCSTFMDEDSSVQLLFGDIFLICFKGNKISDFDVSDYGVFYNLIFGGFDDCETDTEEEEDNIETDEELIDDDNIDEDYEILSEESDNLDTDATEY